MMMLLAVLMLFHIGVTNSQWISNSNQRGAKTVLNCFKEMNKDNNISHLLLDINTPQKIDQFCRKISELMHCIAENEHHLTISENTSYLRRTRGVYQFYLNVCPPGTEITEKYKDNSPCFQLMKTQILSCQSDLPPMTSPEMENDKKRCCVLKDYRNCMTSAAEQKCGDEAKAVMEKILLRYFQVELSVCDKFSLEECLILETTPDRKFTDFHNDDSFKKWTDFYHKTTLPDKSYDEPWKYHKGKHNAASLSLPSFSVLVCGLLTVYFKLRYNSI